MGQQCPKGPFTVALDSHLGFWCRAVMGQNSTNKKTTTNEILVKFKNKQRRKEGRGAEERFKNLLELNMPKQRLELNVTPL